MPSSFLHSIFRSLLLLSLIVLTGCATTINPPAPPATQHAWGSDLPLPPELAKALASGRMMFLENPAGADIPLRLYGEDGKKPPVIMLHGLQSHSGWFAQSAGFLAGLGYPVIAMDRKGSGFSQAPRGDCKDYMEWVEEIATVVNYAQQRWDYPTVYILGHCFGALPAVLYTERYPEKTRGLILTTPGIFTKTTLPLAQKLKIFFTLSGHRNYLLPVPLDPQQFSELPSYEAFIREDKTSLPGASGDFYWQVVRARRSIASHEDVLKMPIFMGLATQDPIADNKADADWFFELPAGRKTLQTYQNARHVLEFSSDRDLFFQDLSSWLAEEGAI